MEPWRLFWAKTNREHIEGLSADWTHPLWAHLIDVGSAAQVLWEKFLPAVLKHKMAAALGMEVEAAGRFLSIWIGLHDLGKGTPSFQEMHEPTKDRLTAADLVFHERPNRLHHGHASIAIAHNWLRGRGLPLNTLLDAAAACVGIHHGKLCYSDTWKSVAGDVKANSVLGSSTWRQAQHELAEAVFTAWGATWPAASHCPTINTLMGTWPDWLMAFAGWATLADWLGSMQSCYDLSVQATDDLAAYLPKSRAGAEKAFQTAGLNQVAGLRAHGFAEHFGNEPRPLQEIARDLDVSAPGAHLVIVEAPTGEGKTEAAFYLAARLGGGMYVAMPSQASSDGLFPRLRDFLAGDAATGRPGAHTGEAAALRLVHGNDLLHDDALALVAVAQSTALVADPGTGTTDEQPDPQSISRVLSWFLPKKRALLVPYGVGTVDQLFLGVLYARHFFLRLFALSGKTVVFDEVHAYDTYMNIVFERLLGWLRALDVHVVVLSATLPSHTRTRLLQAWGVAKADAIEQQPAPYPVAWHAHEGKVQAKDFLPTPGREQRLTFRWCAAEVAAIAAQARALLQQGATVIVICNQVDRAQQVFQLLDLDPPLLADGTPLPAADRHLLHARMPQAWRKQREAAALARFGKKRPLNPALLIGTQVVEQSLDLDADAMITDLAPIDLLLQRAGRLHRHRRDGLENRPPRPAGFTEPVLYLASPVAEPAALPDVDAVSGRGHIYPRPVLWKTYAVLQALGGWALPIGAGEYPGYRTLVEQVYGDLLAAPAGLAPIEQSRYQDATRVWAEATRSQEAEATRRIVPPPRKLHDLFTFEKAELVEDDDTPKGSVPKHLLAATRNPEGLSAEVLLLHRTSRGWAAEPDGPVVLSRQRGGFLTPATVRTLFGAAVRLSQPAIVLALLETPSPEWKALQQQHRLLQRFHLLELQNGAVQVGEYLLRLDARLGLVIEKQGTPDEVTAPQSGEKCNA
jgi:CRISPR-associated endonuclease/helicase Cas3